MREYVADARGFMTELISKAVNKADFDAVFSDHDAERLLAFLRAYGDLDENQLYRGSRRAGYASGGMTQAPTHQDAARLQRDSEEQLLAVPHALGRRRGSGGAADAGGGRQRQHRRGLRAQHQSRIITGRPVQSIMLRETASRWPTTIAAACRCSTPTTASTAFPCT
jgi:hypothetical protein